MNIRFEKASKLHVDLIFSWLSETHMMEFWDNSSEHKDDILNFIYNKPQTYFAGTTQYWVGYIDDKPFAFILSDILERTQSDLTALHLVHLSETGHTISLDFGIGDKDYLGKGLAAPTLSEFMNFYKNEVDFKADTFFIDPLETNPRAINVYIKAGFTKVGDYKPTQGAFVGDKSSIMVRKV